MFTDVFDLYVGRVPLLVISALILAVIIGI